MTSMTHDNGSTGIQLSVAKGRTRGGLIFGLVSATCFGLSGALARGLLDSGWTPGAVVLVRVALAAVLLAPAGVVAMRSRWRMLRSSAGLVTAYGVLGVAGAQFCYFAAVAHMQVGPALMIEYTSPVAVLFWLWLRQGQRPTLVTVAGAAVAGVGLVLVLDLISGAGLDPVGVAWALGAMVGISGYFVISADERIALPPLALATGGLVVGTVLLGAAGLVGALPMHGGTADTTYAGHQVPWWLPLLLLGLVCAALAYSTGIAASRRLGSRLASFVGLFEVVAAVAFSWLLLAEVPTATQVAGGLLILAGVVVVKLGEGAVGGRSPQRRRSR